MWLLPNYGPTPIWALCTILKTRNMTSWPWQSLQRVLQRFYKILSLHQASFVHKLTNSHPLCTCPHSSPGLLCVIFTLLFFLRLNVVTLNEIHSHILSPEFCSYLPVVLQGRDQVKCKVLRQCSFAEISSMALAKPVRTITALFVASINGSNIFVHAVGLKLVYWRATRNSPKTALWLEKQRKNCKHALRKLVLPDNFCFADWSILFTVAQKSTQCSFKMAKHLKACQFCPKIYKTVWFYNTTGVVKQCFDQSSSVASESYAKVHVKIIVSVDLNL